MTFYGLPDRVPFRRIALGEDAISVLNPFPVATINDGYISTANSTVDAGVSLANGETWSGESDSPLNYGGARVIVYSTQNSAADGLKIYCSNNGTDWILDDQYTILANALKTFACTIAPYIKVTFTNGTTPATLKVCTLFSKNMSVVSSHRVQDTLNDDDDGQLVVAIPKLRTAQNTYVSGSATSSGNYKISLEEVNGVVVPVTQVTGAGVSIIETRKQTPTAASAMNVMIGPGDVISNIPVTMDYGHHQIHEGESYSYCNLQTGGLASGSSFDIRISVPVLAATTRTPHMVFEFIANGECEAYLHSGVTWTSGGTAASASASTTEKDNRNHNSVNAANTALYVNGATALTVNSTGTVRYIWYMPSGAVRSFAGDRSITEIDIASNTEYMLRLISRAAGLKFLIRLDWYEDL